MEFHTSNTGGFPSRRSYPNLHHVSLAPLTPRFPIDDDTSPTDYFSPRDTHETSGSGTKTPPRTSYFSSISVPSTPPILSHSRSTSRTRHHIRSKSSSRATPFSDSNLHSRDSSVPLHHQSQAQAQGPNQLRKSATSPHPRRHHEQGHGHSKSDAEWMLRAGIALASSTREEKGQSWLSKRESSTNLVSATEPSLDDAHRHHKRTKSGTSRRSRSGLSTPAALSRQSSRSRGGSRRGSRAGLTMTGMPSAMTPGRTSTGVSGTVSPEVGSRGRSSGSGLVPDFVDERIRAEMASLRGRGDFDDDEGVDWDGEGYSDDGSEYDYSSDESMDEFDEADLQRLTRERGFGLGSWIDRLVEWTLFGVEEWPASVPPAATARIGTTPTSTTVTFEEPASDQDNEGNDNPSLGSAEQDGYSDFDTLSQVDGDSSVGVGKAGSQGGWEDASWLFRVVKQAIL